ncbi:MAG: serpin family protein [candidate division Zixibacteria bacterium]|nr:serpin family protein [candidate division Zixibacteria bacterium]
MHLFKKLLKPLVIFAGLVTVLTVWVVSAKVVEPNSTADRKQAAEADNAFGFRLFNELIQKEKPVTNVVVSPLSAATVVTMTAGGAAGETRDAVMKVLGVEEMNMEQVGRTAGGLLSFLESTDDAAVFKSFQSVWVGRNFKPSASFRDFNRNHFGAEVAALDFSDPAAPKYINDWVTKKTEGLVKDILDIVPPDAVLYLVNAVYFKGVWTYPFKADGTTEAPFILSNGDTVTCTMMSSPMLKVPYFYEEKLGFFAVELPYGDGRFAMTVVLPDKNRDLTEIITALNAEKWRDLTARMNIDNVLLKLPKFKLESGSLLNDALKNMGMGIAFDAGRADFSGMQDNNARSLWISRVLHKAVIEIDEAGTEAGAGTAVEIKKGPPVPQLTADRPFLFAVREISSGTILFLARVADPTK